MNTTGHLQPAPANRSASSMPEPPASSSSITRHAARRTAVDLRNAVTPSKVSAANPNADTSRAISRRVRGSWSTIATTFLKVANAELGVLGLRRQSARRRGGPFGRSGGDNSRSGSGSRKIGLIAATFRDVLLSFAKPLSAHANRKDLASDRGGSTRA